MFRGRLKEFLERLRQSLPPGAEGALTDGQLLACFVARRDESAFATLVRRHGGMVFTVCQRVLGHVQDAEDAFQATFLVLARKAPSLRNGEAVGNWLYGVAYRTALEARKRIVRRRGREMPMADAPTAEVSPAEPQDWRPFLERELNRLPERYRTPVVLCHLEGRSRQEVARQLGVPEGTLSSRLATARQMLAKRLARHHLTISAAMLSAALTDEAVSACVPTSLLVSTARDALQVAAGQTITTTATVLMKEVLQMMFLTKVKLATVFLATVGMLGVLTASFFAPTRAADEKPEAEPKPAAEPAAKRTLAMKITRPEDDDDDMASLLNIYKRVDVIEFQSVKPSTHFGLDMEIYKDGQKQKTDFSLTGAFVEKPTRAKVALLAADLDYLPLKGAKKNHYRIQVSFTLYGDGGRVRCSSGNDVPKELFDFSGVGSGGFSAEAGSAAKVPLFFLVSGSKVGITSPMKSVPEVIKKYSKGSLLIGYLLIREK